MQPRMNRVADIERLQRTMESVPEQRIEEVTTIQAVRMLSSQIRGMQAKGYGLPAIAELMSDNGIVVTAKTLKTYLGEARAPGGRRNRRQTKANRRVRAGAEATAPTTESKPIVRASVTTGDAQAGAPGGRQGRARADDASSSYGALGGLQGDSATERRRWLTAVGVRSEGGHERHLRGWHRVGARDRQQETRRRSWR